MSHLSIFVVIARFHFVVWTITHVKRRNTLAAHIFSTYLQKYSHKMAKSGVTPSPSPHYTIDHLRINNYKAHSLRHKTLTSQNSCSQQQLHNIISSFFHTINASACSVSFTKSMTSQSTVDKTHTITGFRYSAYNITIYNQTALDGNYLEDIVLILLFRCRRLLLPVIWRPFFG